MAVDDLFEIAAEVSVERHGRAMGFRQRDRFGEQTARMRRSILAPKPDLGDGGRAALARDMRDLRELDEINREAGQ